MSDLYDVIIVGAGPGGATAAYFLGEAGKRVLVLEKENIPRYKTCGGGLSAGILEIFPFSFDPVIESRVQTVTYALKHRTMTLPIPDQKMRMVMRAGFDAFILDHAWAEVRPGVAVHSVKEQEDRVIVATRQGELFQGRCLVAADGANSAIARSLGLRRKRSLAAALEIETTVPPEVMLPYAGRPLFIFGEIRAGYLWVFPKARLLSVGIAALRPKPGELQRTLERVMREWGIPLDGAARHGHPIPLFSREETIATRRTLLVGDAAGLVDPFSGEGIRFAIKSGRLAARAILSGRLEEYPRLVHRQIGISHTFGLFLARLFYRFPGACFALGVRNPFVTYAFAEMLADRATYPAVIVKMFATLPLFLLTEAAVWLAGRLGGPQWKRGLRAAVYPALPE